MIVRMKRFTKVFFSHFSTSQIAVMWKRSKAMMLLLSMRHFAAFAPESTPFNERWVDDSATGLIEF